MSACACCGTPRPARAWRQGWQRGYCSRCFRRWKDHGRPLGGPPAVRVQHVGGPGAGRLEDYAELRSWGLTREQAAARLKVTMRTIWRYEAALRRERSNAA